MGTAMSKKEPERARGKASSDDMLSKSTDYTEDSTLPPSLVSAGNYSTRNREIKRGSISSPDVTRATSIYHVPQESQSQQTMSYWEGPNLMRRDSDPGTPRNRSRTIPVKRTSRPMGVANENILPPDSDTDEYLQRMYDSRTWEMYRRITEARKNSNFSYSHTPNDVETQENTSEWENLRHDYVDNASGHEMIFLFDFD